MGSCCSDTKIRYNDGHFNVSKKNSVSEESSLKIWKKKNKSHNLVFYIQAMKITYF